ncbi:5702_t:CDS:2, partial [Acaulospora colombiana]
SPLGPSFVVLFGQFGCYELISLHHRWNAAKCLANFLDTHWEALCRQKRILELGAGGGLPALVVLTDYPDPDLVRNLQANVKENLTGETLQKTKVTLLLDGEFDVILLSDLLFNHSQHDALLRTCDQVLARPTQNMKDMEFFDVAKRLGWSCEEIVQIQTGEMKVFVEWCMAGECGAGDLRHVGGS